jgi:cobalt-zinc-cadmium efflux system membrane fusion protein
VSTISGQFWTRTFARRRYDLEVRTPGLLRAMMLGKATFHGQTTTARTVVPATAILHLHDGEWVCVPAGPAQFHRVEVGSGERLPGHLQELRSGLETGHRVVSNARPLQNTVEQ